MHLIMMHSEGTGKKAPVSLVKTEQQEENKHCQASVAHIPGLLHFPTVTNKMTHSGMMQ